MSNDLLLLILAELRQIRKEISDFKPFVFNIDSARDINIGEPVSRGEQKKEGSEP